MVDTRDLKSLGHYGCTSSSLVSGTSLLLDFQQEGFFVPSSFLLRLCVKARCPCCIVRKQKEMLQKQVLQHLLDERRMVCRVLGREALLGLFPH